MQPDGKGGHPVSVQACPRPQPFGDIEVPLRRELMKQLDLANRDGFLIDCDLGSDPARRRNALASAENRWRVLLCGRGIDSIHCTIHDPEILAEAISIDPSNPNQQPDKCIATRSARLGKTPEEVFGERQADCSERAAVRARYCYVQAEGSPEVYARCVTEVTEAEFGDCDLEAVGVLMGLIWRSLSEDEAGLR